MYPNPKLCYRTDFYTHKYAQMNVTSTPPFLLLSLHSSLRGACWDWLQIYTADLSHLCRAILVYLGFHTVGNHLSVQNTMSKMGRPTSIE